MYGFVSGCTANGQFAGEPLEYQAPANCPPRRTRNCNPLKPWEENLEEVMKRQTKHFVFGLLFTVIAGAGLMIQAQTSCPAQPTCAPVVQTQPVCAPVVQTQPVCAPVVQTQPVCAPVIQAPACCGGQEFDDLLESIEERSDSFRKHIPDALDECVIDKCGRETFLHQYVADFEVATDQLEHNFKHESMTTADAQEVLNRAAYIDSFMS